MNDSSRDDPQESRSSGGSLAPERDYEVGYGKPPVHTRFQKGNPGGGRRKGSGRRKADPLAGLEEALQTKVTVTENGKTRRRSLEEIGHMKLATLYAKGSLQAVKLVHALRAPKREEQGDPLEIFRKEDGEFGIYLDMGNPEVEERILQAEVERRLAQLSEVSAPNERVWEDADKPDV